MRLPPSAALPAALLAGLLPAAAGAQVRLGGEFRVNLGTAGPQSWPAVAVRGDGSFVVVWQSHPPASVPEIVGRDFDALGNGLGLEFVMSGPPTISLGPQGAPAVAADAAGNFLVVWSATAGAVVGLDVRARLLDRHGSPLGDELMVNEATLGNQVFPKVAAAGDGFVVTWQSSDGTPGSYDVRARVLSASGVPVTGDLAVNTHTPGDQRRPAVARGAGGGFVVTWESLPQDGDGVGVFARRFGAGGVPLTGEFQVNSSTTGHQSFPSVAATPSGEFLAVWQTFPGGGGNAYDIEGQRFAADGAPVGGEFRVNAATDAAEFTPAVARAGDGGFVVAWLDYPSDGDGAGLFARPYASSAAPLASDFQVNAFTTGDQLTPALAMDPGGDFLIAWTSEGQDGDGDGIYAQRFTLPCQPGPTVLCLQGGRFKVEAAWRTPQGANGLGQAAGLTADTGYFWFFNPANVELVVKVLNGCPVTNRYWAFAGGLTNVEVDLRVTDTAAGAQRLYRNPQGTRFQPIQDTGALATCGQPDLGESPGTAGSGSSEGEAIRLEGGGLGSESAALTSELTELPDSLAAGPPAARGSCAPSPTRLCLRGGRFAVEVDWEIPQGGSGPGTAVPLTSDTGFFWFFRPENVEMLVKVLNGCPITGHFWVFAGGLTNVRTEFTVTDTTGGASRTYLNPQGTAFQPIQDTQALATCP